MISQDEINVLPPSKNPASITHFVKRVSAISLEGNQHIFTHLAKKLHSKIKKKSLIIMIGDFLGEVDLALLAQRHEIYVIMIRDNFEENPTILGDGEFTDPESGEKSAFYFGKKAKDAYAQAYHDNDSKLIKHLHAIGAGYTKVVI